MEKVLSQEEIDAMVRRARSGSAREGKPQVHVEAWDIRRAGQIGREQLRAITLLHEGFARSLTHALGAYLRMAFQVALVSAENLPYQEFLAGVPEVTCLCGFQLSPASSSGAMQMDLKVIFPIIDVLLGGEGKGLAAPRPLTEIEQQIMKSVVEILCRELETAWQAVGVEVQPGQFLEVAEARRLMAPSEKVLCLSFEISLPDVRGSLTVAVPAVVSNALIRKIAAHSIYRRPQSGAASRERLKRRLLDCAFQLELLGGGFSTSVRDMSAMVPGQVLEFRSGGLKDVALSIAGTPLFRAVPGRRHSLRAAEVTERVRAPGVSGVENADEAGLGRP